MTSYAAQPSFEDFGVPLRDVTFVVVDLETTGTRAAESGITEIGAVKVRGGQVLGEFQSLVNPGREVPAFVARLTGITTAMVASAPPISLVLPSFLEWASGAVLVAHNAPFDIGFLKAAAAELDYSWPGFAVVDTVPLARRVVTRDEAPNYKLSTLANLFHAVVAPEHRALADARATADVFHAVLERLGAMGVMYLDDLATAADFVPPDVRRKRHLADDLPDAPGVYLFKGPREEVLYVGTSKNIRRRVRSYFTKAEKRRRITEMVRIATEVTAVVCATELEAAVRELRLITSHAPRYNRRSVHPERQIWVRLTDMPHPRLQLVQQVCEGSAHIGPFTSRRTATEAVAAIRAADALTAETLQRDPSPVVTALATRIGRLAAEERFEEAGAVTERLRAFLHGAARAQHFAPLAACAELVAAHPTPSGGWELIVVRHGRLVATAVSLPGGDPWPVIAALRATAEVVDPPTPPAPACHPEETALILQWLDAPGTRLVHISEPWAMPLRSAAAHTHAAGLARAVGSQIGVPEPSGS